MSYDRQDLDRVWAVSDDDLVRSDDGGETWEIVHTQYHYHGFAVDPLDGDTLLVGSVASGNYADTTTRVYRSTDAGETWTDTSTGLPESESSAHTILHWPGHSDVVLLGTYKGGDESHTTGEGMGMFRSTDRGDSWAAVDLDVADVAWLTVAPGGVAAATGDGLWHSTDEGVTWTRYEGPEGAIISAAFQGDLGLALGAWQNVWRTDDGGETWYAFEAGLRVTPEEGQPDSWLGAIALDAGGEVAYVTDFPNGVWRVGL
jgi:photosystem II stability/assembly factor-like uncharacterized protein